MSELHFPWLAVAIVLPLAGAIWIARLREPMTAKKHTVFLCAATFAVSLGAWLDLYLAHTFESSDRLISFAGFLGDRAMALDKLSAPLLALMALLFLMTAIATPRARARRFSFAWMLVSESILLATFACKSPWGIVLLLSAGTICPFVELRARRKPTRVFVLHMALFIALLAGGWALADGAEPGSARSVAGVTLLLLAVFIRSGIVPFHCWMTDLFENATFGTALLFVTPMAGAYAAMRLVLPIAPDWALRGIAITSLVTAVYAAGTALVQREARRFFCYLFISHSALVLVGLEIATPIGLTGALSVWLSVGLAMTGFGLTMRSMEARTGRLSLDDFHGLYEHAPTLAAFFLLTGLASVGFPGTFGFVGTELLVDGAVQVHPFVGTTVVLAAALNGIAVLQCYFRIFTGARHTASISLTARPAERFAILALAALILGGGLFPQPGVASRYEAAMEIVRLRQEQFPNSGSEESHSTASLDRNVPFVAHAQSVTNSRPFTNEHQSQGWSIPGNSAE